MEAEAQKGYRARVQLLSDRAEITVGSGVALPAYAPLTPETGPGAGRSKGQNLIALRAMQDSKAPRPSYPRSEKLCVNLTQGPTGPSVSNL